MVPSSVANKKKAGLPLDSWKSGVPLNTTPVGVPLSEPDAEGIVTTRGIAHGIAGRQKNHFRIADGLGSTRGSGANRVRVAHNQSFFQKLFTQLSAFISCGGDPSA